MIKKYNRAEDIVNRIKLSKDVYEMKVITFDWDDIAMNTWSQHRKIIKLCKLFGKVKRTRQGFAIYFSRS